MDNQTGYDMCLYELFPRETKILQLNQELSKNIGSVFCGEKKGEFKGISTATRDHFIFFSRKMFLIQA